MNKNDIIRAGIELYTGRVVLGMVTCADPKVDGAVAVRCRVDTCDPETRLLHNDPETLDFLLAPGWSGRDASHVSESLEECTFASWPPNSGKLRFST